ncbi:MAG TPA: NUDIX domain-containing protein [Kofleriaceae bacterium]|nr:NUDIX domain-containing protein [Kofleriaceae bacterium]
MPTPIRDAFCNFCGTKYPEPLTYPRTCQACQQKVWANPIPVSVVIVPVEDAGRTGILVVRRAIPPQIGKLGIVGGFLEAHESWQQGGARETREETGVHIDAATLTPLWFASSEPNPHRVLLFSVAPALPVSALPPYVRDAETSERGLVYGPGGLEGVFAFSTHVEAAKRYFGARGVTAMHDFAAR